MPPLLETANKIAFEKAWPQKRTSRAHEHLQSCPSL